RVTLCCVCGIACTAPCCWCWQPCSHSPSALTLSTLTPQPPPTPPPLPSCHLATTAAAPACCSACAWPLVWLSTVWSNPWART
ncbi:hypothetical protein V8C86DRAFT_2479179, partial [Haematococcus lacustris]